MNTFKLKYKVGDILIKKNKDIILHNPGLYVIKISKIEGSFYKVEFDNHFYHYSTIENSFKLDIKSMRKEKIKKIEQWKNTGE